MSTLASFVSDVMGLCLGSCSKASIYEKLPPRGTDAPFVLAVSIISKFKNISKLKLITVKNYNIKTIKK